MTRIALMIFFGTILFFQCKKTTEISIDNFQAQNEIGKNSNGTKVFYFLVTGYTGKDSDYDKIERHVCGINRDSLHKIYKQFWLAYYRKSNKTNNENIATNPKDFFIYSTFEDHIVQYSFITNSIVSRRKYYLNEYPKETDSFREYELCK